MNTSTQDKVATLPPAVERQGLVQWAATKFGVDAGKVFPILKATCFKGADGKQASDAEVAALMIVAREHGLNPFLKEIYAFPDKKGGIVPVVGVDGWISIVNSHPQYNGVDFIYEKFDSAPAWVECHIYRKDRGHPIKVKEFLHECRRDTGPWKSHPARMLRHKAFIQCARVAFGFAGIFDEDEGERIIEATATEQPTQQQHRGGSGLKQALLSDGINVTDGAGQPGTDAESTAAKDQKEKPAGTVETRDEIVASYGRCSDTEALDLVADTSREFQWTEADQAVLSEAYSKRRGDLGG